MTPFTTTVNVCVGVKTYSFGLFHYRGKLEGLLLISVAVT